jgi:DNA-binding protein YbaB
VEYNEDLRRTLESMAGESAEYFHKSRLVQERLAAIIGTAASDDGFVKVTWRGDGLSGLEINPRAMRMGSAELAETILRLSEKAKADGKRQAADVMSEVYGAENPADLVRNKEALQSSLAMMEKSFTGAVTDSLDLIQQLQRQFKRE